MIRIAALLLLLVSGYANALICDDGVYRAATSDKCPGDLINPSATLITTTSASINSEGDDQAVGATRYIYVSTSAYPPGCTAANVSGLTINTQPYRKAIALCTRHDLIKAGTGASAHTSETLTYAGQYAKVVTGLASGTAYYAHSQAHGGGCDYPALDNCTSLSAVSLVQTQSFTTGTGGGGGPGEVTVADEGASPRYIGTGGSDLADGLTHANRWLTLAKVTGSLPAGTNVGLLSSSSFSQQSLDVSHTSTSKDRAIIGSYKLNGSSVPIWTYDGVYGSGTTDTKATIVGHLTVNCMQNYTCDYRQAAMTSAGLSSNYDSYIRIHGTADYTTIQNIRSEYTGGIALYASGSSGDPVTNLIVDGFDSDGSQNSSVLFEHTQDSVYRNGYIDRHNMCPLQQRASGTSQIQPSTDCYNGTWGGGFTSAHSTVGRNLIENNVVVRGFGEAIDILGTKLHIVRGNVTSDSLTVSVYLDATETSVAENNMVIAGNKFTSDTALSSWGTGVSMISSYKEDFWGTGGYVPRGNVIRNNLCVGSTRCVNVGLESAQAAAGRELNTIVSGNTSIDENTYWITHLSYSNVTKAQMHNNVSWGDQGSDSCYWPATNGTTITNSHNHAFVTPANTVCNTNLTTGVPNISLTPLSGWASFDWDTHPTWANAAPTGGGAIKGTGTARTTAILSTTDYGDAWSRIAEVLSGALTQAEWQAENTVDAQGTTRASPPSKGAIE